MNSSYDGYNNTVLVNSPYPNATEYYPNITADWNSTFENSNWTWTPYLTFGDVTSMLYASDDELYNPFGLYEQACWDGDVQNCTSVCTDPAKLFSNVTTKDGPQMNLQVPYNILSCMFYPVLSKLLAKPEPNDPSWQQLKQIGDQYNIIPNASSDLIQTMVDTQVNCYVAYCSWQDSSLCLNFDFDTFAYQAVVAPGVMPVSTEEKFNSNHLH